MKSCGAFTPDELVGTWRGFMVKNNTSTVFDQGEYDFVFGKNDLTVTPPEGGKAMNFNVSTT